MRTIWKMSRNCGSQQLLQKKLITGNYLKKIKERKITEIQDFNESVDLIDKLIEKCANYIKNSNMSIYNFKRNEEKFLNSNLGRKEYFSIGHYNPENKNKKCCRFSDLSQIKLDHPKYIIYEAIISTIVDVVILLNRNRSVVDPELKKVKYKHSMIFILNKIDSLGNFLEELKFLRRFSEQKIQSDLISFFQKKQSKGRGNLDNLSYYSFVNLLVK